MAGPILTLELRGFQQLGAKLDGLPHRMQRTIVRRALRVAGNVVLDEARARAPRRTDSRRIKTKAGQSRGPGFLAKHIRLYFYRPRAGQLRASVGPTKAAFYGKFDELGTSRQPARPWLRPALQERAQQAVNAFGQTFMETLTAELTNAR